MHVERRRRLLVGLLLAALSLAIAACGAIPTGAGPGDAPPNATETLVVSTAHATIAHNATHSTNAPTQVALIPGASGYDMSDSINVVVRNSSSQTIYAVAHFTDCSVVSLERLVGSSWQPVNPCTDGFPHPAVTRIAPGADLAIQLPPMSASSAEQTNATTHWPLGTYRIALTYTVSLSAAFSAGATVLSAQFVIV